MSCGDCSFLLVAEVSISTDIYAVLSITRDLVVLL